MTRGTAGFSISPMKTSSDSDDYADDHADIRKSTSAIDGEEDCSRKVSCDSDVCSTDHAELGGSTTATEIEEGWEFVEPDPTRQATWLSEDIQIKRLTYSRSPDNFRTLLKNGFNAKELACGAFVDAPRYVADYIERLMSCGHQSVEGLTGKDVIVLSTPEEGPSLVECAVAKQIPRSDTKPKHSPNDEPQIIPKDERVSPSAPEAELAERKTMRKPSCKKEPKKKPPKWIEYVRGPFVSVKMAIDDCAKSVASSTDAHIGRKGNPRRRFEESRACGVLDNDNAHGV
jgi:hypothetical protein